jgi:hypothetical protein
MIESLCMISAKFSCCILMIDSYFPHAMKMCTIQGSPKVQLVLLYPEVNGVNLLLHGRDGLSHGCHRELHGAP